MTWKELQNVISWKSPSESIRTPNPTDPLSLWIKHFQRDVLCLMLVSSFQTSSRAACLESCSESGVTSSSTEPAASLERFLCFSGANSARLLLLSSEQALPPPAPSSAYTGCLALAGYDTPSTGHDAYLETSGTENISWLLLGAPQIKIRGSGKFKIQTGGERARGAVERGGTLWRSPMVTVQP